MHLRANMIHNIITFYHYIWRATSHILHLLKRSSIFNCLSRSPWSIYTFVYEYDPQQHNVLTWYKVDYIDYMYQPYSTYVEEGIWPQHSSMFYNMISDTRWRSSKKADSDKVSDILVITKKHTWSIIKTAENKQN